ncbi:hypothetical protein CFN58_31595 [Pseudomonas avellanae]|nr:hypothetical protein CFN58_31595 [Pseudomonas avellanae]
MVRLLFCALQPKHLSFLTLQRRNALRDALRHRFALRRALKIGRRASRTACDAERRTIVRLSFFTLRPRHLSFLTLQRRNALGDALRHRFALRRALKTGRGALHDGQSDKPQRLTSNTPDSIWWVYGNWSNRAQRSTRWVSCNWAMLAARVSGLQEMYRMRSNRRVSSHVSGSMPARGGSTKTLPKS